MGADFIMAVADITKTDQYWRDALAALSDTDIDAFISHSDQTFEWADRLNVEVSDDLTSPEPNLVADVRSAIGDAISTCYSDSRETNWFTDPATGTRWLITGGMSWGDAPTDAFDDVLIFDVFQGWLTTRPESTQ